MTDHRPPRAHPAPLRFALPLLLLACGADNAGQPLAVGSLRRVAIEPSSASMAPGETERFRATGIMTDGTSDAVPVSFAATGGTITGAGVYTAGRNAGEFIVVATEPASRLADTAKVTVTVTASPPPPLAPGASPKVAGEDWSTYGSDADLKAKNLFDWPNEEDVRAYYALVPDATFGKAVRITFPANTGYAGASPRLERHFPAIDKMWYRWRVKFTPGWTTIGPDPSGWANSYKIAFWLWNGYDGRGELQYTNSTQYVSEPSVQVQGTQQNLSYTQSLLPGSPSNFGWETTEWTDGEWYEFVAYYEKTGPTTARQAFWRRRLTNGGQEADNPWTWYGFSWSGSTTPQVSGIVLGGNKNKNNPTTMYLTWGPFEVVDASRSPNPFGMRNVPNTSNVP
jgi:hypothetical protein